MSQIAVGAHPINDRSYVEQCRAALERDGALVLPGFFTAAMVDEVVSSVAARESEAFYADSTHNVYLRPDDPAFAPDHSRNRPVASTKGLIADDQIDVDSPLRQVYGDREFRRFLCSVLGITEIHDYDDTVSSINVHFAAESMELGWHFDNSAFAVTMLLRAPVGGGTFEYVAGVRDSAAGDDAFDRVAAVLDGEVATSTLDFEPGALVLFRGRDALHRVTPTEGGVTRLLVVFAYNEAPGVRLSESALATFYGRPTRTLSGEDAQ